VNVQLTFDTLKSENPRYLDSELITYIGNKRTLLPFVGDAIQIVKSRLSKTSVSFLDLFAGSGVISRFMKAHSSKIVCNDLEEYAKVINGCYLANKSTVSLRAMQEQLTKLEKKIASDWRRGFIAELYAPEDDRNIKSGERVFFTRRNAEYIDTVRQHLDSLPSEVRSFFLANLLVKASIHNNTGGVFKGFYKNREGVGAFGGEAGNALKRILGDIHVDIPTLSEFECDYEVTQLDAVAFAKETKNNFDLAYLDPPYNQHPYGSNYFMLNLISSYTRPTSVSRVSGIPDDWNRSPFNKPQEASEALFSIIENLPAKFLLISYNSEGFIKKDEMVAELKKCGKLDVLETSYNTYRASRNLSGRSTYVTEYLYLLEK